MPSRNFPSIIKVRAFSLVELIIVIVIIGILSAGFTSLFVQSAEQYVDANQRRDMSASTRTALERISRELRDALPNSVRVSGNGSCVEFRPVSSGQIYLDIPLSTPSTTFNAAVFTLPAGSWSAAVMPLDSAEAYDVSGGTIHALQGIASVSAPVANIVQVSLSAPNQFPRTSPAQRFFITGTPISFCVTNGELRRYSGYGVNALQPTPGGGLVGGVLLTKNISNPNNHFTYLAGTLERNALLRMSFAMTIGDESLSVEHEALIRNVP